MQRYTIQSARGGSSLENATDVDRKPFQIPRGNIFNQDQESFYFEGNYEVFSELDDSQNFLNQFQSS